MKKIFIAAIFAITSSFALAQDNSTKDLYLTKSFNDGGFKKINAETTHGNISLIASAATETKVEVYVRSNNWNQNLSKEEIQKKLDEYYTIDVSLSADVLNAVVKQKKYFTNGQTSLSISFKIYTSKNKSTSLKTDHGNVAIAGMQGREDVSTDHGNISAEDITGKLKAETSHGNVSVSGSKDDLDIKTDHGNIDAKDCEGTVKLITTNGNLDMKNVKGKLTAGTDHGNIAGNTLSGTLSATSAHGDVALEELACSLNTSTDHGNINLSFDKIAGDIIADNSNGNISVTLPKGKNIDLDLKGKGVDLDAMENFSGSKKRDEVKGSINGGGTKVSAKTDHGQVSVTFK